MLLPYSLLWSFFLLMSLGAKAGQTSWGCTLLFGLVLVGSGQV